MAKSRKNNKKNNNQTSSKRSVRVQDLRPNKNPTGGVKIDFIASAQKIK